MSASAVVPLTVTYAPSGAATTTVTVLGQILNNGGTNWIPTGTSDHAIYLATTSEENAAQTVLDGMTYYLSTGPAVPAQVTITPSSFASASTSGPTMGDTSSGATMTGGSSTTAMTNSSPSMSASAAASSSSSTGGASRVDLNCASAARMGLAFVLLCGLGFIAA